MTESLGKKYSFRELLEENDFSILVPLIQRDYVQGKPNKEDVRNEFLLTLKKYLLNGENKDLDFVYGYVEKNNFIPLDGQQRLTTLFLLHTYLAITSNNFDEWQNLLFKEGVFKFKYEVRRSSSEFCKALIINGIDFKTYESEKINYESFQYFVSNLHWYKLSWNLDPTISSMINMLNTVHNLFKNEEQLWYKLSNQNNPVLTFLFLDLKDLNQGDELYIKMNARGKMLTNFENFKARFEEKLGILFKDDITKKVLKYNNQKIELSIKDYFSFKLDSVWSNLFWTYRDLVGNPDNYDDEIFNFIKEILIFYYIKNADENNHQLDVIFKSELQTFNQLNDLDLFTNASIEYLISVLDIIQYNKGGVLQFCQNKYFNENELFKDILSHKIQNPDRVKFYAYLEYQLNGFEVSNIQNWMRVVTNLVENKILNSQDMVINAFKSIDKLIPHSNNIIEYLTTNPIISFFDSNQILEEKMKAKIFQLVPSSYEEIYLLEQAVFHAGQISYLLEISGVLEVMTKSSENTELEKQLKKLNFYGNKAVKLFKHLDTNKEYMFERGLLTYGNYLIKKGDSQYNFSSSRRVANYDRDYSWKKLLSVDLTNIGDENWKPKRDIFYTILKDEYFDFNEVEKSLKHRILNFDNYEDWRFDFVKNHEYINACGQGFIFTNDNFNNIQLLNASQMNHLRMDVHVFKFWLENNFQKYDKFVHYLEPVKGYNDVPFVSTQPIILNRKNYALQFYKMETDGFYVRFYKTKGYNNEQDYGSDSKDYVTSLDFKWNDDEFHKGFTFNSSNYSMATKKYIDLLQKLN